MNFGQVTSYHINEQNEQIVHLVTLLIGGGVLAFRPKQDRYRKNPVVHLSSQEKFVTTSRREELPRLGIGVEK